ncbi:hypothetical protein ES708_11961 [subsurface metagenome]
MKRYRCCNCGAVFTGWGIGESCRFCGGKLKLIVEEKSKGANKNSG